MHPERFRAYQNRSRKRNGHKYIAKQRAAQSRWVKENAECVSARRKVLYDKAKARGTLKRYPLSEHAKAMRAERERLRRFYKRTGESIGVSDWNDTKDSYLGLCVYCLDVGGNTIDHVEPLSKGGTHSLDNIAPACFVCNSSKKATPLVVWLARRAWQKQLLRKAS